MKVQNLGVVKAIHIGLVPPINNKLLWYDINIGQNVIKYYKLSTNQWAVFGYDELSGDAVLKHGEQVMEGKLSIKQPEISGQESHLELGVQGNDNDYMAFKNATKVNGKFIGAIISKCDTKGVSDGVTDGNVPAVYWIAQTNDEEGLSAPALRFDARDLANTQGLQNRPLFGIASFNVDKLIVDAQGKAKYKQDNTFDSDRDIPNVGFVRTEINNSGASLWDDRGNFLPSGNYPSTGGSGVDGALLKNDLWTIHGLGVGVSALMGTKTVYDGYTVRAVVDAASQSDDDWAIGNVGLGYTPENTINKKTSVVDNKDSHIFFATCKAVYDFVVGLFVPLTRKISINGDTKTLEADVEFQISTGGAISSGPVFLSNNDSSITGYKALSYAIDVAQTDFLGVSNNNTVSVKKFAYPSGIDITEIFSGLIKMSFYAKTSNISQESYLVLNGYQRKLDNSEVLLFTAQSQDINSTSTVKCDFDYTITSPITDIAPTSLFVLEVLVKTTRTSDTTITFSIGDSVASSVALPIPARHSTIRGRDEDGAHPAKSIMINPTVFNNLSVLDVILSKLVEKFDLGQFKMTTYQTEYDNGDSGPAKTIDWNNGQNQKITLTANCVLTLPSITGTGRFQLKVIQDGTGSRSLSFTSESVKNPTNFDFASGTANQECIITFYWDGAKYIFLSIPYYS